MAARPRKHNIDIPNLYCKLDKRTSKIYWQYRHPVTGVFVGFGLDADAAKAAAMEMNRIIAEQETQQSYALIDMAIKQTQRKNRELELIAGSNDITKSNRNESTIKNYLAAP